MPMEDWERVEPGTRKPGQSAQVDCPCSERPWVRKRLSYSSEPKKCDTHCGKDQDWSHQQKKASVGIDSIVLKTCLATQYVGGVDLKLSGWLGFGSCMEPVRARNRSSGSGFWLVPFLWGKRLSLSMPIYNFERTIWFKKGSKAPILLSVP